MPDLEIAVTTELTSTTITNILEAVPGIKNVLRSPAADAMVNLTRCAVGIGSFDIQDARELLRFAFRRGLIGGEEHDRVLAEVETAAQARQERLAARKAARDDVAKTRGSRERAVGAPKPKTGLKAKSRPARKAKKAKPVARKGKPAARKAKAPAKKRKPLARKAKAVKRAKPSPRPKPKARKAGKRR